MPNPDASLLLFSKGSRIPLSELCGKDAPKQRRKTALPPADYIHRLAVLQPSIPEFTLSAANSTSSTIVLDLNIDSKRSHHSIPPKSNIEISVNARGSQLVFAKDGGSISAVFWKSMLYADEYIADEGVTAVAIFIVTYGSNQDQAHKIGSSSRKRQKYSIDDSIPKQTCKNFNEIANPHESGIAPLNAIILGFEQKESISKTYIDTGLDFHKNSYHDCFNITATNCDVITENALKSQTGTFNASMANKLFLKDSMIINVPDSPKYPLSMPNFEVSNATNSKISKSPSVKASAISKSPNVKASAVSKSTARAEENHSDNCFIDGNVPTEYPTVIGASNTSAKSNEKSFVEKSFVRGVLLNVSICQNKGNVQTKPKIDSLLSCDNENVLLVSDTLNQASAEYAVSASKGSAQTRNVAYFDFKEMKSDTPKLLNCSIPCRKCEMIRVIVDDSVVIDAMVNIDTFESIFEVARMVFEFARLLVGNNFECGNIEVVKNGEAAPFADYFKIVDEEAQVLIIVNLSSTKRK